MTCRARSPEGRIVCKSIQNTSLTSPDTNYYQIDQVRTHLVTFGPVLDHVSRPNPFDSCVFAIQNVSKNRPDERTDGRTHERTHTHGFVYGPHTISPSGNNLTPHVVSEPVVFLSPPFGDEGHSVSYPLIYWHRPPSPTPSAPIPMEACR